MDADTVADLKQFIKATVSQQLSLQTEELGGRMDAVEKRLDSVEEKIDDLSASVAEAIETGNQETDKQLKDHERRFTRLEKRTA